MITGYAVAMPKTPRRSRTNIVHPTLAKFMRKHRVKEVADVFKDENLRKLWEEAQLSSPIPEPKPWGLVQSIAKGIHELRGEASSSRAHEVRSAFMALTRHPSDFEERGSGVIQTALIVFSAIVEAATFVNASADLPRPEQPEQLAEELTLIDKLYRHLHDDGVRRRRFVRILRDAARRYSDSQDADLYPKARQRDRARRRALIYVQARARVECDPRFALLVRYVEVIEEELIKLSGKSVSKGYEHAARLSCLVRAFDDGPLPKKTEREREAIRRFAKRYRQAFGELKKERPE